MQQKLNERLVALATLQNIPICVTNEVRYLNKDEAFALDLLQASAKGMMLDLEHQVQTDQLYLNLVLKWRVFLIKNILKILTI